MKNNMLEIAICDDSEQSTKEIEEMLEECASRLCIRYNLTKYSNGIDFRNDLLNGIRADIVFLDIEIGEINGVDLAETMRDLGDQAVIIYVTSYDCYISQALRTIPLQYLKKPVKKEDFNIDFNRAVDLVKMRNNQISLSIDKSIRVVNLKDIYFFEILQGKTYVCIKGERFVIDKRVSLSKLLKLLDDNVFLRVHHAILVNLHNIIRIESACVVFSDNIERTVSRTYKQNLLNHYNSLISGIKL